MDLIQSDFWLSITWGQVMDSIKTHKDHELSIKQVIPMIYQELIRTWIFISKFQEHMNTYNHGILILAIVNGLEQPLHHLKQVL